MRRLDPLLGSNPNARLVAMAAYRGIQRALEIHARIPHTALQTLPIDQFTVREFHGTAGKQSPDIRSLKPG